MEYPVYKDDFIGKKSRKRRKARKAMKKQFGSVKKAKKAIGAKGILSRKDIIDATAWLRKRKMKVTPSNLKMAYDRLKRERGGKGIKRIARGAFSLGTAAPRLIGGVVTKKSKRPKFKLMDTKTKLRKQFVQATKGKGVVLGAAVAGKGVSKAVSKKPPLQKTRGGISQSRRLKGRFGPKKSKKFFLRKKPKTAKARGDISQSRRLGKKERIAPSVQKPKIGRNRRKLGKRRMFKNITGTAPAEAVGKRGLFKGRVKKFVKSKIKNPFSALIPLKGTMASGLKAQGYSASKREPTEQLANKFYNNIVVPSRNTFDRPFDIMNSDNVDDAVKASITAAILEYIAISKMNKEKGTATKLEEKVAKGAEKVEERINEKIKDEAAAETGKRILFDTKTQLIIVGVIVLVVVAAIALSKRR